MVLYILTHGGNRGNDKNISKKGFQTNPITEGVRVLMLS